MNERCLAAILMCMTAVGLAACGGGGGDDEESADEGPPDASGAGIWLGTLKVDGTTTNLPFSGIVTEEGDYALIGASSAGGSRQFFGQGSTNGNNFTANAVTYLNFVRSVPASMQGTITDRVSINGSYALTNESATFNLAYQAALYERPASLAVLQGAYSATHTPTGNVISAVIEASGTLTISYTQPAGCVLSGTVTVPQPTRNYYRVAATYNSACAPRTGPMRALLFMTDVGPGQNNQFVMLGQLDAQTFSEYIPPVK